jgi:hypothetical protein
MEFKSQAIKSFYEKYRDQDQIDSVISFLNKKYGHKTNIMFNFEQALSKVKSEGFISNDYGKTETLISFDNGFRIVRLLDQDARLYDAKMMRNCIGDYGEHFGLYSFRDEQNIPHLNFEIKRKKVKQIMGVGNSKVAPKYMEYVNQFYKKIKLNFNCFEIERLGYTKEDLLWVQFKKYFENIQYVTINNEKYIYEVNKLNVIKQIDFKSEYLVLYLLRTNQCDEAIFQLVKNGTDVCFSDNFLLKQACIYGRINLVRLFVKYGADVSANNNAAIRAAAQTGRIDIVRYLIRNGADIHVYNDQIKRHSIRDDNEPMMEFFKKGYSRIDKVYSFGYSLIRIVRKFFKSNL